MVAGCVIPGGVVRGRRNPVHHGLPKRLRAARESAGLGVAQLSLLAGLPDTAVRDIEVRGHVPLLDKLERLAQALKVSPCALAFDIDAAPLAPGPALQCAAVGSRLTEVRTDRGLSRKALGVASDSSDTTVRNIEEGKAMPSIATVEKLAKALGCDPCWLAYGASAPPDLATSNKGSSSHG